MLRGPLVLATLLDVAQSQCPDCAFDVTALEEFSTHYTAVSASMDEHLAITTQPLPDTFPQEEGTIALSARNLQVKFDSHLTFPTPFAIGPVPLSGMTIHEELHVDGSLGRASFHIESPIVNLCFQLDGLPPAAQMEHDQIEMYLQQGEQMGPQMAQQAFQHWELDGADDVGPTYHLLFTQSSHPAFLWPPPNPQELNMYRMFNPPPSEDLAVSLAATFDHYSSSVGNQFAVRACEIQSQSSSQSLLAGNPDAREFVVNRIRQHQRRLQSLLQPHSLGTRLNFVPLEIADLLVPAAQDCTNDELAQIPGKSFSTMQAAAFGVGSFVMGVAATFVAIRKRTVTPADDYHQVAA